MPHANLPALHGTLRRQAGAPSLPSPKRYGAQVREIKWSIADFIDKH